MTGSRGFRISAYDNAPGEWWRRGDSCAHDSAMTDGNYGSHADRLDGFMQELEAWRDELTVMSSTPLPDLFHKLADEHDGAVAALLEELRERDGRSYRLTKRGGIPSSLPEEASPVLEALLAADSSGDLPQPFTYQEVKNLGRRYEALQGRCWPEFRALLAGPVSPSS